MNRKKVLSFLAIGVLLLSIALLTSCPALGGNNPPTLVIIMGPSDGDAATSADVIILRWKGSTDPDGDNVLYDIYFGTASDPPLYASGISATSFTISDMDPNATYFWKVLPIDSKGATPEEAIPIWTFTTGASVEIVNNPPGKPLVMEPLDGAEEVNPQSVLLRWTHVTDSDGDTVTYDVYLDRDGTTPTTIYETGLTANKIQIGEYNENSETWVGGLERNNSYVWKVVANDGRGGMTTSNTFTFLTSDETFEYIPPTTPSQPYPQDQSTTDPDIEAQHITELRWSTIQDYDADNPAGGSPLYYDVYFGTDADYDGTADTGLPLVLENYAAGDPTDPSPDSFAPIGDVLEGYQAGLEKLWNGTIYFWKVVVTDEDGAVAEGPVWTFTTATNNTVPKPDLDGPAFCDEGIMLHQEFTWSVSPDYDADTIKSDFYIDTDTDFSVGATLLFADLVCDSVTMTPGDTIDTVNFVVSIDTTDTVYDSVGAGTSTGLKPNTKYFWKVVVKDDGTPQSSTSSDVWNFTTDDGYGLNEFIIDEEFLAYESDGSIETDVPDILSDSIYDWGTSTLTIDKTLGNPYPSLKLDGEDYVSTIPVNHFSTATLEFDFKIGNSSDSANITFTDSNNPSAIFADIAIKNGIREQTTVTPDASFDVGDDNGYWIFSTPTKSVAVWYQLDADAPDLSAYDESIMVTVIATDDATTVVTKTTSAINSWDVNDQVDLSGVTSLTVRNVEIGHGTASPTISGISNWSQTSTFGDFTARQTHIFANDYEATNEVYRYGVVAYDAGSGSGVVEFNTWIHVRIVTDFTTSHQYTVYFADDVAGQTFTRGEVASVNLDGPLIYTLEDVDMFTIKCDLGTVWVDNLQFSITEAGWLRSIY